MKSAYALSFAVPVALVFACGSARESFDNGPTNDGGPSFNNDTDADDGNGLGGRDPTTCDEAKQARSYVGCDYWPTVTPNIVQDVFDFAVAVANVGTDDADVTVTGPGGVQEKVTVGAGKLEKVYLPWVDALKGTDSAAIESLIAKASAYHLVSSRPVVVYQFNPLEFKAAGGPPGKNWAACVKASSTAPDCYSYSNDASLLLPSTAMTNTYRVMGPSGQSVYPRDPYTGQYDKSQPPRAILPGYATVTATQDGTKVDVKLGKTATVVAGSGIASGSPNGTLSFTLDAGDVALVATPNGQDYDLSGSLLTANKPVQVITGIQCANVPFDIQACDHLEETVFPAETLGKHYLVARPTGPMQNNVGHVVRFYGNVDGTKLTYKPSKPTGCPATLSAGEVAECSGPVEKDFEVSSENEFGVSMFLLGGELTDPNYDPLTAQPQGDPSQSFAVAVEQYRKRYVFLAPADYKTNYVDIIGPADVKLTLDGKNISDELNPIDGTDWFLARVKLSAGKDEGAHVLDASAPVGIQVLGYGDNTTYMYPGGLNLGQIASVPVK